MQFFSHINVLRKTQRNDGKIYLNILHSSLRRDLNKLDLNLVSFKVHVAHYIMTYTIYDKKTTKYGNLNTI